MTPSSPQEYQAHRGPADNRAYDVDRLGILPMLPEDASPLKIELHKRKMLKRVRAFNRRVAAGLVRG